MPNISFVKSSETTKDDLMNVDMDDGNIEQTPMETSPMDTIGKILIALIETQPHKVHTKNPLEIAFSFKGIIRNVANGPLYITS